MPQTKSLPLFYASMLGFLMSAKQQLGIIAKKYDLSIIQSTTLMLINIDEPKPMNAFQKLYNCDASNITGIIDGLEEKGLVTRGEKADDRRVKIVLLTTTGAALKERINQDFIQIEEVVLKGLEPKELEEFKTTITKLAANNAPSN